MIRCLKTSSFFQTVHFFNVFHESLFLNCVCLVYSAKLLRFWQHYLVLFNANKNLIYLYYYLYGSFKKEQLYSCKGMTSCCLIIYVWFQNIFQDFPPQQVYATLITGGGGGPQFFLIEKLDCKNVIVGMTMKNSQTGRKSSSDCKATF